MIVAKKWMLHTNITIMNTVCNTETSILDLTGHQLQLKIDFSVEYGQVENDMDILFKKY